LQVYIPLESVLSIGHNFDGLGSQIWHKILGFISFGKPFLCTIAYQKGCEIRLNEIDSDVRNFQIKALFKFSIGAKFFLENNADLQQADPGRTFSLFNAYSLFRFSMRVSSEFKSPLSGTFAESCGDNIWPLNFSKFEGLSTSYKDTVCLRQSFVQIK
jgi:hypothetical protein